MRSTGLVVLLFLASGCGTSGGHDAAAPDAGQADLAPDGPSCAANLKAMGPACVPKLDDCKGGQIPLPGGGCKRIGVEECDGGIKGPPSWTCKPVGPPTKCLPGWSKTKDGWCEPVLPTDACEPGYAEKIGSKTCVPVDTCGAGTWGAIPTTGQTLYVDASYTGASDGTKSKPFTTINAALDVAPKGAQIAVAAGTYEEELLIDKPLTIVGRCAQLVTIRGKSEHVVRLHKGASGSKLGGVTVTGAMSGIDIEGVKASLERVVIQGCGSFGLGVVEGEVRAAHLLVADNRSSGVFLLGARGTFAHLVVRRTKPNTGDKFGVGVTAYASDGRPSQVSLQDSVLLGNHMAGAQIVSSDLTVTRSAIVDTRSQVTDGQFGNGIWIGFSTSMGWTKATLVMSDTLVARNRAQGLFLYGAKASIERSVIRDTLGNQLKGDYGEGIYLLGSSPDASLVLKDSAVVRNCNAGVFLNGSKGTIERTVIRDTKGNAATGGKGKGLGVWGFALNAKTPSSLVLRDSLVVNNRSLGIAIYDTTALIERCVVRDTLFIVDPSGCGIWADAFVVATPSPLTIRDSLFVDNPYRNFYLGDVDATLERTVVGAPVTSGSKAQHENGQGLFAVSVDRDNTLTLKECLVSDSLAAGLAVYGTKTRIERSVVRGSRPTVLSKMYGIGLRLAPNSKGKRAKLEMSDSLVADSQTTGIQLFLTKATIKRSVVRRTRAELASGGYGDGIVAVSSASTLDLANSWIDGSARAGLLFDGAGGEVSGSAFTNGVFSIDLESSAKPKIGQDNHYSDNDENRLTVGKGLKAPPPPVPPKPSSP